jgi:hypothetical protein
MVSGTSALLCTSDVSTVGGVARRRKIRAGVSLGVCLLLLERFVLGGSRERGGGGSTAAPRRRKVIGGVEREEVEKCQQ